MLYISGTATATTDAQGIGTTVVVRDSPYGPVLLAYATMDGPDGRPLNVAAIHMELDAEGLRDLAETLRLLCEKYS